MSEFSESAETNLEISSGEGSTYRLAGFWPRLWAFLIDIAVIAVSCQILFRLVWPTGLDNYTVQAYVLYNNLFPGLLGAAYLVLITKHFGQTLGKMIIGIKVIQTDGQKLQWSTVIIRELIARPLSQLLGTYLGYLVCAFHPRKQAVHDLLSDTCVIYVADMKSGRYINIPAY